MMLSVLVLVATLVVVSTARSVFVVLNYLFYRPSEVYNRRDFLALNLSGFLRCFHNTFLQ